jgi:hypothetical protein
MKVSLSNKGFGLVIFVQAMFATVALGQPVKDPDWPCVQALVPEISASTIWAGPLPETLETNWYDDQTIADSVYAITSRRTDLEQANTLIDEFAKLSSAEKKNEKLTLLFGGVLQQLNKRRTEFIQGIKRFTRHQDEVAKKIEGHLNEKAGLKGKTDETSNVRRAELEETIQWMKRMFEDREKSIASLCEKPVRVDELAGELARAIANHLE